MVLRLPVSWVESFIKRTAAGLPCELRGGRVFVRPVDLYQYIVTHGNGAIVPMNPEAIPSRPPTQP